MKWTGLTGGIATGKSTAKKLIEGLGVPVVDADKISHKLTEVGASGYLAILSQFGKTYLAKDQTLDRKKLGHQVFSDPQVRVALENILHPLIKAEVQKLKMQYEEQAVPLCFYDVPLLFEKNMMKDFHTTVLVWCNNQTQLERLMKRNGLSADEAYLRIKNQLPMIDKVKMSDHCVDNSGEVSDLGKQLESLISRISLKKEGL